MSSKTKTHQTTLSGRKPFSEVHQDKLWNLFVELYESGETDDLQGGVHPQRMAEDMDPLACTIRSHLNTYVEEGKAEKVSGISPNGIVRESFVPLTDEGDR